MCSRRPEEERARRNRRPSASAMEEKRRTWRRYGPREIDSLDEDDHGDVARLMVLSAWRGDGRSDGAMAKL
jgi:hypothetical protein